MANPPLPPMKNPLVRLWSRLPTPWLGLLNQMGWITGGFVAQQGLRLVSSIVLAWLLAPQLLGTMLLLNTLRTGGELLSDVGVGQSIVSNRKGADSDFFNAAWTIQIIRGIALFAIAMGLAQPIAALYDRQDLATLVMATAPVFLLTGFTSPARFLLQKTMQVKRLAVYDLVCAVLGTIVQIALAWMYPTIWALILGLLIATGISALGSYFLMDWRQLRLRWDRDAMAEVMNFGKWIFLSSLVYFLAMNFDRLYFADAISFALLGIYGIARTFADTVMQFFQRMGHLLIFPKISASERRGAELLASVSRIHLLALAIVAVGLAIAIALADQFILLVYDDRYRGAAIFLPILFVGTWFGILAAMADAILLGVGKPAGSAFGNIAKLLVIAGALPLVLPPFGIIAALGVFVLAEAVRYGVLAWRRSGEGLHLGRQEAAMTVAFVVLTLLCRELTQLLGLTTGVEGWLHAAEAFHG